MNLSYLSSAEQRARAILEAYGSNPDAWPVAERQATLDCIAHSTTLQRFREQAKELDRHIATAQAEALAVNGDLSALQQRILAGLPKRSHSTARRQPSRHQSVRWWRPRLVAAMACALLLVIVLDQHSTRPVPAPRSPATASFAAWTWYDITGQPLTTKQTASTISMGDLIDMEIDQGGG